MLFAERIGAGPGRRRTPAHVSLWVRQAASGMQCASSQSSLNPGRGCVVQTCGERSLA